MHTLSDGYQAGSGPAPLLNVPSAVIAPSGVVEKPEYAGSMHPAMQSPLAASKMYLSVDPSIVTHVSLPSPTRLSGSAPVTWGRGWHHPHVVPTTGRYNVLAQAGGTMTSRYPCPCCGFLTLDQQPPGSFAICPVCWWEDDDVQGRDPAYAGGANAVSLRKARENFRTFGAAEARFSSNVRRPTPEEVPEGSHT